MPVSRTAIRTALRASGRHTLTPGAAAPAFRVAPATGNEPAGMDENTGRLLVGWPWVVQSALRILTTAYFEEVMRPHVGSNARKLFGELANLTTAQRFRWAVGVALLLFVPHLRPTSIGQVGEDRTGATDWVAEGDYVPRVHRGDKTDRRPASLTLEPQVRGGTAVTG